MVKSRSLTWTHPAKTIEAQRLVMAITRINAPACDWPHRIKQLVSRYGRPVIKPAAGSATAG
jgi:hypothetical protein